MKSLTKVINTGTFEIHGPHLPPFTSTMRTTSTINQGSTGLSKNNSLEVQVKCGAVVCNLGSSYVKFGSRFSTPTRDWSLNASCFPFRFKQDIIIKEYWAMIQQVIQIWTELRLTPESESDCRSRGGHPFHRHPTGTSNFWSPHPPPLTPLLNSSPF